MRGVCPASVFAVRRGERSPGRMPTGRRARNKGKRRTDGRGSGLPVLPSARPVHLLLSARFGGLDLDEVLIAECSAPDADNEAGRSDAPGQVREREGDDRVFVRTLKLDGPEIAREHPA